MGEVSWVGGYPLHHPVFSVDAIFLPSKEKKTLNKGFLIETTSDFYKPLFLHLGSMNPQTICCAFLFLTVIFISANDQKAKVQLRLNMLQPFIKRGQM